MRPVFVLSAVRTPVGNFGGGFASMSAAGLGEVAARAAIERSGLPPAAIDETIFGHARQAGGGPNTARQVSHRAGIPDSVPAFTVNKACASSLKALTLGALSIAAGESEAVLVGGTECMSATPYLLPPAVFGPASGTVHAGNSSGITDAASALVLASEEEVRRGGNEPLGRVVAWTSAGVEPERMGIGPVPALKALLAKQKLALPDVDMMELNEAFAAQVIACARELP